ncbi:NAD(P)-binding protein [Polyplosphaeria fusca]|uniref:NAD(P)-binding protein n=1 Tax=Polyplosphaeria fusca TaxID=682080 RepID=A0A9P4UX91_9PLEO|nr:NAD(P)-binding protein [Polyplosphaeria fusca]
MSSNNGILSPPPLPTPVKTWHTSTYPTLSPSRPELSVSGKSILITGGGTGIGAATAQAFAQAGAARIAILGRRLQPLLDTKASIEAQYPKVSVFTSSTDITSKSAVDAAVEEFAAKSKIDVLISNAAMIGPHEDAASADGAALIAAVQANLSGALWVAQAFLRNAAPDAVAIDVSSTAAHANFSPRFASYSVAKMAIGRLWDAMDMGAPDVRVFHIQPGVVDTDMNRAVGGVAASGLEDHVSLPSTFMVWLASDEARFLKGKFLWSNWDVDELKEQRKELEGTSKLNLGLIGWPFGGADNFDWGM